MYLGDDGPIEKLATGPGTPLPVAPPNALGRRVASSAIWMVMLRFAMRFIGLVSSLILVRLLTPRDFGIVAMASVAYGLLDSLSEFSLELVLIQLKAPERRHYDTAWTLGLLRGAAISLLMVASAPFVAEAMAEPRIQPVIYVLALSPLVQSFGNITLVDWKRDFNFNRIFWLQVFGKGISFCLVLPAAFILRSYWALIVGTLGTRFILVGVGYALRPYRPRFSFWAWAEFFHFSKWLMASNLLGTMDSYVMTFLIGRIAGPSTLGLFNVAKEIAYLPASEIAAPIRQPMYAAYVKLMDDVDALRRQALDGLGIVLMLVVPLSVGLAVTADLATPLFLGPKWLGATPFVAICSMFALFDNIAYFTHHLYIVRHAQARFAAIFGVLLALRVALLIPIGILYGVMGAAVVILVTSVLMAVSLFVGLAPLLRMSFGDVALVSWRIVVSACGMAAGVLLLAWLWPVPGGPSSIALHLTAETIAGAVLFIGLEAALWLASGRARGPEAHAVEAAGSVLARARRRMARSTAALDGGTRP